MRNISRILLMVISIAAMAGVYACGEKAPPVAQQPVKKKISMQQKTPPQKPQAAAPQPKATPQGETSSASQAVDKGNTATASDDKIPQSELIKETMMAASSYDPKDRFDPFEPLFKDEPTEPVKEGKAKRIKRRPQTPLERVALSQLKLSAIMRTPKGNSAIVEDAKGKGYVIKKGTYIGLNSGQVIRIDRNGVVIEEEIEDVMGEISIRNTELKLQKPAGEL